MIKTILFDIDGTILDFLAAESAAIKKCFETFNLGVCTDDMVKTYSQINVGYWKKLERKEIAKKDLLVNRFKDMFALYHLDTSIASKFNDEYQLRLGDIIVFYEGAKETLLELKNKEILICAVTNGTKIAQSKKLKNSHLDEIFDYVFISEDIGYEKPSKEFFTCVFNSIPQFDKNQIMIVGDSLTSDILGGINAGIKTCYFNPNHFPKEDKIKYDYEIDSLKLVLNLI